MLTGLEAEDSEVRVGPEAVDGAWREVDSVFCSWDVIVKL